MGRVVLLHLVAEQVVFLAVFDDEHLSVFNHLLSLSGGGGSDVADARKLGNHIFSYNGKGAAVGKADKSSEVGGFGEHDALSVVVENLVIDIVVEEVFDVGDFAWQILAFHTHGERTSVFAWGWIETHFCFSRALRNNQHHVASFWEVEESTIFA